MPKNKSRVNGSIPKTQTAGKENPKNCLHLYSNSQGYNKHLYEQNIARTLHYWRIAAKYKFLPAQQRTLKAYGESRSEARSSSLGVCNLHFNASLCFLLWNLWKLEWVQVIEIIGFLPWTGPWCCCCCSASEGKSCSASRFPIITALVQFSSSVQDPSGSNESLPHHCANESLLVLLGRICQYQLRRKNKPCCYWNLDHWIYQQEHDLLFLAIDTKILYPKL